MKPYQFITLILLSLSTVTLFATEQWLLKKDEDNIQVFTKNKINSSIKQFKGITIMPHSVDQIAAVLLDASACSQWLHQCEFSSVLETLSFGHTVQYQQHDLPFPVDNRDVIFQTSLTTNPITHSLTLTLRSNNQFCQDPLIKPCQITTNQDFIRVGVSEGIFLLEPIDPTHTRVTWQQHAEPGGSIPEWLVNSLLIDIPHFSLRDLKTLANSKKYQHAKLLFNPKGEAINLINPKAQ